MTKSLLPWSSIGGRLLTAFLCMAFLVTAVTLAASRQTAELEHNLQQITDELIPILTDTEALARALMELSTQRRLLLKGKSADREMEEEGAIISAQGMVQGTLSSLDLLLHNRHEALWHEARRNALLLTDATSITQSSDNEGSQGEEIERFERAALSSLEQIRLMTLQDLREQHRFAEQAKRESIFAQRLAAVVALILAGMLSFLFTLWFSRPLDQLSKATEEIRSGNFDIRLNIPGNHEFAQLARAFQTMASSLQESTVSRKKLTLILTAIPDPLAVVNLETQIRETNPAWSQVLPFREGARLSECWPELGKLVTEVMVEDAGGEGRFLDRELRFGPESDPQILQISLAPVSGLPTIGPACVVIAKDITNARRTEAQLREFREKMTHAEQLASLGSVAAILSHKLNQPLSVIRLLIQQMQRNLDKPDALGKKLTAALQEVDVVSNQLREVLQYSRPIDRIERSYLNIGEVLDRVLELFEKEGRVQIELEGFESLPEVFASADQLEEVFYILLENAEHASQGASVQRVQISATPSEKKMLFSVRDFGEGMSEEVRLRAFEPFFSTKSAAKGTGLGLARLKQIVTALDGEVWIESDPGEGTRVFFTLPIRRSAAIT